MADATDDWHRFQREADRAGGDERSQSGVSRAGGRPDGNDGAVLAALPPPAVASSPVRYRVVVGDLLLPIRDLVGRKVGSECHFDLL
jgi:hypothetical protein